MLRLLKIYFLFNVHFILIKCTVPGRDDDLSVRILDKKLIDRKRQDTRDMCNLFNSETIPANLPKDPFSFDKYNARKRQLKLQEKREELKKKKEELKKKKLQRIKREVGTSNVNPALDAEDEARVETIVDRIYDDLLEKGQKIPYRSRSKPTATAKNNNSTSNKSGRRFPFAPLSIDGPNPTFNTSKPMPDDEIVSRPVRFPHGIVPYFIDSKTYDTHLVDVITKAFEYFEKATCIRMQRLRERPTDQQSLQNIIWLYITNPSGIRQCVHSNERAEIKGVQMIVFGYDCMSLGDISHEIMHVLGFPHEHMRSDRDQYITILWDNIKPGYRKYFEVHDNPIVENLPYDYASVLHYPSRAFSRNGQVTILTEPGIKIGQREGLSEMDIEKIRMLYANECIKRTRDYLLQTCPTVIKADTSLTRVSQHEIEDYFEDRLWPYGIVNFKLRDEMEFSTEERENINAVIRHIEKETCIEFRDLTSIAYHDDDNDDYHSVSLDNESDTDDAPKLVVITGAKGKEVKAVLPDSSSSDEKSDSIVKTVMRVDNKEKTIDIVNGTVKRVTEFKEKNGNFSTKERNANISATEKKVPTSAKVKNASTDAKEKNAFTDAKEKNILVGAKENNAHNGAKENNAHNGAKEKNSAINGKENNVPTGAKEKNSNALKQQSVLRRKREVPISPARRHAISNLVLTRSAEPGCHCPQPGKPEGEYVLEINADCFNSVNDLLHLFVHLLGLDHQHNMHDRDSYLHIVWDELSPEIKKEMRVTLPPAASVGFPYDYQSVMHYPWLQIKNGKTNIMYPIWNDGWAMGHWQGLSSTDVQKLNLLYFKQCMWRRQYVETTTAQQPQLDQQSDSYTDDTE